MARSRKPGKVFRKAIKQRKERFRKVRTSGSFEHYDPDEIEPAPRSLLSIGKKDTLIEELEKQGVYRHFTEEAPDADFSGLVIDVFPRGALVRDISGSQVLCEVAEYLWSKNETPVAAGDDVEGMYVRGEQYDYEGVITGVRERRTVISIPARRGKAGGVYEKILAANIDVFVIVDSIAQPEISLSFVDRCLVVGQREGDKATIFCVNKVDLAADVSSEIREYTDYTDHLVLTSAETGEGVEDLKRLLAGRRAVLVGRSGVGKSSLLQSMCPGLDLEALPVMNKGGKGRHTTRRYSLFELDNGGLIIDTPGFKEISLINIQPAELTWYFPEFTALREDCKFSDCTHTHEPCCGIKQAVEEDRLSSRRYERYLRIMESLETGKHY